MRRESAVIERRCRKAYRVPTADPGASEPDADRSATLPCSDAPSNALDPIRRVEGTKVTVLRTLYDSLVKRDANREPMTSRYLQRQEVRPGSQQVGQPCESMSGKR